jgi:hypothetical protein
LKERKKIKCMKERSVGVNFSMPLSLLSPISNLDYPNISALSSNSSYQPKKNKSEHLVINYVFNRQNFADLSGVSKKV